MRVSVENLSYNEKQVCSASDRGAMRHAARIGTLALLQGMKRRRKYRPEFFCLCNLNGTLIVVADHIVGLVSHVFTQDIDILVSG
jgi:hypothetical protein